MIEVQHLSKKYGPFSAVDDVSFRAESGEILGFLGPNGAGKTTTMRIITGYMPATEGKATVAGFDVFDQPLEAKRRTGYLPETPPLYPDMTVRDYLRFVAKIKGVRANVNDRVDAAMKKTWVADMANRHCGKLSKGYKQRVGLAQALIHEPEVLVLDEPTAGLDPKQIIETRQLIRALAGSHTIVLSTHILPEVAQTCQKVVTAPRRRSVRASGVSVATILPLLMITTFWQVCATSGRMWVLSTMVCEPASSRISWRTSMICFGSRPAVGSSSTSTSGS